MVKGECRPSHTSQCLVVFLMSVVSLCILTTGFWACTYIYMPLLGSNASLPGYVPRPAWRIQGKLTDVICWRIIVLSLEKFDILECAHRNVYKHARGFSCAYVTLGDVDKLIDLRLCTYILLYLCVVVCACMFIELKSTTNRAWSFQEMLKESRF